MAVLRQESEICRLKKGDRVGLIACSDARPDSDREKIGKLCGILRNAGLKPVCGDLLFGENGQTAPAKERARELMGFYRDPSVRAIFDVSGGNLANGLLPWLDFRAIAESEKLFWGYSDLTALIGAILSRSGRPSALWQIRNLLEDDPAAGGQLQRFIGSVLGEGCSLFAPECRMLRGARMEGVAAGGNIRCLLKLAGTPFWPDPSGKILVLEARSGGAYLIETMLCQLAQTGAFSRAVGVLLGTFTELDREGKGAFAEEMVLELTPPGLPVAKTAEVGHGKDSRAILIGGRAVLERETDPFCSADRLL